MRFGMVDFSHIVEHVFPHRGFCENHGFGQCVEHQHEAIGKNKCVIFVIFVGSPSRIFRKITVFVFAFHSVFFAKLFKNLSNKSSESGYFRSFS